MNELAGHSPVAKPPVEAGGYVATVEELAAWRRAVADSGDQAKMDLYNQLVSAHQAARAEQLRNMPRVPKYTSSYASGAVAAAAEDVPAGSYPDDYEPLKFPDMTNVDMVAQRKGAPRPEGAVFDMRIPRTGGGPLDPPKEMRDPKAVGFDIGLADGYSIPVVGIGPDGKISATIPQEILSEFGQPHNVTPGAAIDNFMKAAIAQAKRMGDMGGRELAPLLSAAADATMANPPRQRPATQPDNNAPALAANPDGWFTQGVGQFLYNIAGSLGRLGDARDQGPVAETDAQRKQWEDAAVNGDFGVAFHSFFKWISSKIRAMGEAEGTNVDPQWTGTPQTGWGKTVKVTQRTVEDYRAVVNKGINEGWLDLDRDVFRGIPDETLAEALEQQQIMLGNYDRDTYVRNTETALQVALLLAPQAAGTRALQTAIAGPGLVTKATSTGRMVASRLLAEGGVEFGLGFASARDDERLMTGAFAAGANTVLLGSAQTWRFVRAGAPGGPGTRFVRGMTDDLVRKHGLDPLLAADVADKYREWGEALYVPYGTGNARGMAMGAHVGIDQAIDGSLAELSARMGLIPGGRDADALRGALAQQSAFEKQAKKMRINAQKPAAVDSRIEVGVEMLRAGLTKGDIKSMFKGFREIGSMAKLRALDKVIDRMAKEQPILRDRLDAVAGYLAHVEGETNGLAQQIADIRAKFPNDVAAQTKALREKQKALMDAAAQIRKRMADERKIIGARVRGIDKQIDTLLEGLQPEVRKWVKDDPDSALNAVRARRAAELENEIPEAVQSAALQLGETRTKATDLFRRMKALEASITRRVDGVDAEEQAIIDRGNAGIVAKAEAEYSAVLEGGIEGTVDKEIDRIVATTKTRTDNEIARLKALSETTRSKEGKAEIALQIEAAKLRAAALIEKAKSAENRAAVKTRLINDDAQTLAENQAAGRVRKAREIVAERAAEFRRKRDESLNKDLTLLDDMQNEHSVLTKLEEALSGEIQTKGADPAEMASRASRVDKLYKTDIDKLLEKKKNRQPMPAGAENAITKYRDLVDQKTELVAAHAAAESVMSSAIRSANEDFISTLTSAGQELTMTAKAAREALMGSSEFAAHRALDRLSEAMDGILPRGVIDDVFGTRMPPSTGTGKIVHDLDKDARTTILQKLQEINRGLGSVIVGQDRSLGMPVPESTRLRLPRVVTAWAERVSGVQPGTYKSMGDIPVDTANWIIDRYEKQAKDTVTEYYEKQKRSAIRDAVANLAKGDAKNLERDISGYLSDAEVEFGLPPGTLSRKADIKKLVREFHKAIELFKAESTPLARIRFIRNNPEAAKIVASHITDLMSEGYLGRLAGNLGWGPLTKDNRIETTVEAMVKMMEWTQNGSGGKTAKMFDIPQKIANAIRDKAYGTGLGPWWINNFVLLNDAFGELGLDMNRVVTAARKASKLEHEASEHMAEPMRGFLGKLSDAIDIAKERGGIHKKGLDFDPAHPGDMSMRRSVTDLETEFEELITDYRDAINGSKDARRGVVEIETELQDRFKVSSAEIRPVIDALDHVYDEFYVLASNAHPGTRRVQAYTPRVRRSSVKAPGLGRRNISKPTDPFYKFERKRTRGEFDNVRSARLLVQAWYDSYMKRFAAREVWETSREMYNVSALLLRKDNQVHPLVEAMKNVAEYAERKRAPIKNDFMRSVVQIGSFRHALMLTGVRTAFRNYFDPIIVSNLNDFASTRNFRTMAEVGKGVFRQGDYAKDARIYNILKKYHATGDHERIYSRSSMIVNEVMNGYGGGSIARASDAIVDFSMWMMRQADLSGRISSYSAGEKGSIAALEKALANGGDTNTVFAAYQREFGPGRLSAGEWNDVWVKIDKHLRGGTADDLHEFVGVSNSYNTMFDYNSAGVAKVQSNPYAQIFLPFYSYMGSRTGLTVRAMARGDLRASIGAMMYEVFGITGTVAQAPILREAAILGGLSNYLGYIRTPNAREADISTLYPVTQTLLGAGVGDMVTTLGTAGMLAWDLARLPASDIKFLEDVVTRNQYESGGDDGIPGSGRSELIDEIAVLSEQLSAEGSKWVRGVALLRNIIMGLDVAADRRSLAELGMGKRIYSVYTGSRPSESSISKQVARQIRGRIENGSGEGADTLGTLNSLKWEKRTSVDIGNGMKIEADVQSGLTVPFYEYVKAYMARGARPKGYGLTSAGWEALSNPYGSSAPIMERTMESYKRWNRERKRNW